MNRSQQIRQWFEGNPGRHFIEDVLDGMSLTGRERQLTSKSICRQASIGQLSGVGRARQRRYTLGRPARAYKIKGDSND